MTSIKSPKKLIEVALPLDKINEAAAREKSIRHGHPSTLHLWWARRPLAAARAVIFAQMVNDPGYQQGGGFKYGVNKEKAAIERDRLFKIIEDLVLWENTNNEEVLQRARAEIWRSWRETCALNQDHPDAATLFNPEKLPAFHDPFAGGGALPLEAQRLGLESYASDLNPVAVTINKAMIEIPPKFAGRPPVGPMSEGQRQNRDLMEDWFGARGLAEDVRRYGAWMRAEAERRIGHFYPKIEITAEIASERSDLKPYIGQQLTVITWIWARTLRSPNPAYSHAEVPLASTFVLSSKKGKEAFVVPVVDGERYRFMVKVGPPPNNAKLGTKISRGANFQCLLSNTPIEPKHIYAEANAGRMGSRLMAIVAETPNGRVYLSPTNEQEKIIPQTVANWKPDLEMPNNPRWFSPPLYGVKTYGELFTPRQLIALTTFSDLVQLAIDKCRTDAVFAGMKNDDIDLDSAGDGAFAYAQAVGVYLGITSSKATRFITTLSVWRADEGKLSRAFGRQAIPMTWDYAETNPFSDTGGDFDGLSEGSAAALEKFTPIKYGLALQENATKQMVSHNKVVSTDPPYYDNIGYADLSDYFYVWLRPSLREIYPKLYATLATPKEDELVATPYRHGGKDEAEEFFLHGMTHAINNLAKLSHPAFPITIYYAFKQSESKNEIGTSSTGWETFLDAVLSSGLVINGTWPVRTEGATRVNSKGTNALASSIVLVCQKRPDNAATVSRREFIRELNASLPQALDEMTRGGVHSPVAPVDLSQAIIGPGIGIFTKYKAVLEADGGSMSVRTALQLINRFLAEDDFDHDTQFCLHWFETQGWAEGQFGVAEVLSKAKGTTVNGLQDAGVVESGSGKLRLLKWPEYPRDWSPETDSRTPVWEALHQLIRAFNQEGETSAGSLLAKMPSRVEPIRSLAYRLYTLCERKGWAEDARAYNEVVTSWAGIERAASEAGLSGTQIELEL